jgi:YidC/Oxa1 family membrane protein insertase
MGFFEIFSGALSGFYALIPSLGLAIILLTLAVRLLLLPLSIKQTRSMREMQRIQPELKKLQAKYKGNRQKLNEEMMKLYKEHNVNPFGGCLPLLMQFPVLIGLFYVVRTPLKYMGYMAREGAGAIPGPGDYVAAEGVSGIMETIQQSRLADDLLQHPIRVNEFLGFLRLDCTASDFFSSADPSGCGGGLVSALPYLILVALMGLTTWYQQKQMQGTRGASDPQMQQMQLIGRIMPIMLMFFSFTFPSGVVLYWLTTNVWTIGQQRLILKAVPVEPPPKAAKAQDDGKDGKVVGKGKTTKAPPGKAAKDTDGRPQPGSRPSPSSKKKRRR